jgi:hypothetical protein
MRWDTNNGRIIVDSEGPNVERVREWKKVDATNMVSLRAIKTWGKRKSRVDFNVKGRDNRVKASSVIHKW